MDRETHLVSSAIDLAQNLIEQLPEFIDPNVISYDIISPALIQRFNSPEVKEAIRLLQRFSTTPSWYDLLEIFIPKPGTGQDTHRLKLAAAGFDSEFIDLLFYQFYRPRTDMFNLPRSMLVLPQFNSEPLPPTNQLPSSVTNPSIINMNEGIYRDIQIPVIRYQEEYGSYYYEGGHNARFCGTFYYFQYNSEVILHAPVALVTMNKLTAAMKMGLTSEMIAEFYEGDDPTRFVEETGGIFGTNFKSFLDLLSDPNGSRLFPLDQPAPSRFYMFEDFLDQIICNRAQELGVNVIILQRMVGKSGYVTEVLDVRERIKSYSSLIFPIPVRFYYDSGSSTIVRNYDDIIRALNSGNEVLIEAAKQVRRVRYGVMDSDLNPSHHDYQSLDINLRSVAEVTGAITLSGNISRQLEYLKERSFFGDVSIIINERINSPLQRVIGELDITNPHLSTIKIALVNGDGKYHLVCYVSSQLHYYCPYSWAPIPRFNIESLHIDGNGDSPVPKNIGITPLRLVLLRRTAYPFLVEALETYPTITEIDSQVAYGELTFPRVPNLTVRKFIPVTLKQVPETIRAFPNLIKLEVYAPSIRLIEYQRLTSIQLFPKAEMML